MNKDSIDEMEQIQKGLEEFLEKELKGYQSTGNEKQQTSGQTKPRELNLDLVESTYVQSNRKNLRGTAAEWVEATDNKSAEDEAYNRRAYNRNAYGEAYEDEYQDEYEGEYDEDIEEMEDMEEIEELEEYEDWDSAEWRQQSVGQEQSEKRNQSRSIKSSTQTKAPVAKKAAEKRNPAAQKSTADQKNPAARKKTENVKKSKPGKRKKKSGIQRFFRKLLITVLLLAVLLGGGLYMLVGKVYGEMQYSEIESLTNAPVKEDGVTNILLIGNDSRSQGEDGRSDAMILVSISNRTRKIYMTSLLRDIYVDIPGYQGNRLNAAYSYGGAELLMDTIEQNFDITVNRYVLVNFQAFANLVDAVGGIELELTNEEVSYINAYLVEYNILEGRAEGTDYLDTSLSGMMHLNGPQALAYTRNRFLGTDFGRTERQRKVLEAVIHQLPKALVTNPGDLINGLMSNLTTNLTQGECFNLSLQAPALMGYDLVQSSIPVEGSYSNANIRGMAVLEIDFEQNKEYIRKNIYGEE